MIKKLAVLLFLVLIFGMPSFAQYKPVLTTNGEIITEEGVSRLFMLARPNGKFIMWEHDTGGEIHDVKAALIDDNGNNQWTTAIANGPANEEHADACVTADGNIVVAWTDERIQINADIYLKKLNYLNGGVIWGEVRVSDQVNDQTRPKVCPDKNGGVYVVWWDSRPPVSNLFAQHIGSDGNVSWTQDLQVTSWMFNDVCGYQIVADGVPGGTGEAWVIYASGEPSAVYAHKIYSEGNQGNTRPRILLGEGTYFDAAQAGDYLVVAWQNNDNIYAKCLDTNGNATASFTVCDANGIQEVAKVVGDGSGAAYVVWHDRRNEPSYSDIYLQKISYLGDMFWDYNGIPVTTAEGFQAFFIRGAEENIQSAHPVVYSDNMLYVAWHDFRRDLSVTAETAALELLEKGSTINNDIFMQAVDAMSGEKLSQVLPVCSTQEVRILPEAAASTPFLGWMDYREGLIKARYQIVKNIPTQITGISTLPAGSNIKIMGQGFGSDPGDIANSDFTLGSNYNNVSINGAPAGISSWTPTEITLTATYGAFAPGTYLFEVTAYGDASSESMVVPYGAITFSNIKFDNVPYTSGMDVPKEVTVSGRIEGEEGIKSASVNYTGSPETMSLTQTNSYYNFSHDLELITGARLVTLEAVGGDDGVGAFTCSLNVPGGPTFGNPHFDGKPVSTSPPYDNVNQSTIFTIEVGSDLNLVNITLEVNSIRVPVDLTQNFINSIFTKHLSLVSGQTNTIAITAIDEGENVGSLSFGVKVEAAAAGATVSETSVSDPYIDLGQSRAEAAQARDVILAFSISKAARVNVVIYNPAGQPVKLVKEATTGYNEISMDRNIFLGTTGIYIIGIYDKNYKLLGKTWITVY